MFFDDYKKAATLIRGKRDAKGNRTHEPTPMKPEHVMTEPGVPDGKHMAMEEFMAAHREGSAQKMAAAMSNFMDMHSAAMSSEANDNEPTVKAGPDKES